MKRIRKLKLGVEFFKEGDSIVAYSHSLDLATHGATLAEAKKNFHEAVDLWFDACVEKGTLDKALLELGWVRRKMNHRMQFEPPRVLKRTEEPICIPV
jgi:predicted RNase H-like HicB family nuclease